MGSKIANVIAHISDFCKFYSLKIENELKLQLNVKNYLKLKVGWALIWFAQNAIYLYAGRVLQGIVGGAIFAIFPLYLSEIAVDR